MDNPNVALPLASPRTPTAAPLPSALPSSPSSPSGYCPTCRLPLSPSGHRQCACTTTTLLALVVSSGAWLRDARNARSRRLSASLIDALASLPSLAEPCAYCAGRGEVVVRTYRATHDEPASEETVTCHACGGAVLSTEAA
jgi:hypothetical protein